MNTRTIYIIALTCYFTISFYCFGALAIENEVNYQTWMSLPEDTLPVYHQHLQRLLFPFFMVPLAIQFILAIMLLFLMKNKRKNGLVIALVLTNLYILVESFLVQVPIHESLNNHGDANLVAELIETHRLYRLPAEILLFILTAYFLFTQLNAAIEQRKSPA